MIPDGDSSVNSLLCIGEQRYNGGMLIDDYLQSDTYRFKRAIKILLEKRAEIEKIAAVAAHLKRQRRPKIWDEMSGNSQEVSDERKMFELRYHTQQRDVDRKSQVPRGTRTLKSSVTLQRKASAQETEFSQTPVLGNTLQRTGFQNQKRDCWPSRKRRGCNFVVCPR